MAETASEQAQLEKLIARYDPEIASLAKTALVRMRQLYPHAVELVYDNYNAVAIGFAPSEKTSEAIFSIALYPRWISLFFLQAKGLADPDGLLLGKGNVARHIRLSSVSVLDEAEVHRLMKRAVASASKPFSKEIAHRIIIKSISPKQRPRRPAGSVS